MTLDLLIKFTALPSFVEHPATPENQLAKPSHSVPPGCQNHPVNSLETAFEPAALRSAFSRYGHPIGVKRSRSADRSKTTVMRFVGSGNGREWPSFVPIPQFRFRSACG